MKQKIGTSCCAVQRTGAGPGLICLNLRFLSPKPLSRAWAALSAWLRLLHSVFPCLAWCARRAIFFSCESSSSISYNLALSMCLSEMASCEILYYMHHQIVCPCTFPIMCNVPSVWYSCLSLYIPYHVQCSVSVIFLSVPVHSLSCVMICQCDIPVCPCTFPIMCNVLSVWCSCLSLYIP